MKSLRLNVSALWRPVRLLVAVCACALIMFANALPAYSLPNPFASDNPANKSATTKPYSPSGQPDGEVNLTGIEKESQKSIYGVEPGSPDLGETQRKASEGLNEVQGAADREKMSRPENSSGETIEGILEDKLEGVKGQK